MVLLLCVLQLADNQIIESKLIQVNKKKIAYIYVILKKGLYICTVFEREYWCYIMKLYIYSRWVYCMVIPFASLRCKGVIY